MHRTRILPLIILLFGCANDLEPASDLSGNWAATFSFPGSSLELTLSEQGPAVTGTGTYQLEAGGGGTLQVDGVYHAPNVSLTLHYDDGRDRAYVGTVQDASHIAGALEGYPLPFVRK